MRSSASPIFCALDTPDLDAARTLAARVSPHIGGLKLGLEFFTANGPDGVRQMMDLRAPVFLDLKLHDIPNTVAGALGSLAALSPAFVTLHTTGGAAMMRAAAETVAEQGEGRIKLLGVTVLTSLDDQDLSDMGVSRSTAAQVVELATLAKNCGIDGIVCSPQETAAVRAACGPELTIVTPGIRPADADAGDQKRVMTPTEALDLGADILVIGRPITKAPDPGAAAAAIARDLDQRTARP